MTVATRKGVLLRLPPALLERVDAAKGALSRNEWLVNAIGCHLDDLDAAVLGRDPGLQFGSVASRRPIRDEDGSDLGLVAERRDDGALEISKSAPEADGGPPAGSDPGIDAADPDEPEGADNGSSPGDWAIP